MRRDFSTARPAAWRSPTPGSATWRIGPALQEIRLAGEEIHSDTGEPAGTLRLNVPNHIGTLFLDQLLIDFMIRYPKMRVETVSEARMIDIVAEGYDARIRLEESVRRT